MRLIFFLILLFILTGCSRSVLFDECSAPDVVANLEDLLSKDHGEAKRYSINVFLEDIREFHGNNNEIDNIKTQALASYRGNCSFSIIQAFSGEIDLDTGNYYDDSVPIEKWFIKTYQYYPDGEGPGKETVDIPYFENIDDPSDTFTENGLMVQGLIDSGEFENPIPEPLPSEVDSDDASDDADDY